MYVANLVAYAIALINELASHFFVPGTGDYVWRMTENHEWVIVSGSSPVVSEMGKSVVGSSFTIFSNIVTFLAQASALLAAPPQNP